MRYFFGRTEKLFAACQVEHGGIRKILLLTPWSVINPRRNRPGTIQKGGIGCRFLRNRAPSPRDALKCLRLRFRHSGFHAQLPGLPVDGEYLRQWRSARKNRNRLAPKLRLKTNDCLGWKSGTNRDAKANVPPLSLAEEREPNRTYLLLMVCASASERSRRVATALVNESLLPELQILRTSKPLFEWFLQRGSICLLSAGTGAPKKRSFSHRTLHPTEAGSSVCFRLHGENETTCSN